MILKNINVNPYEIQYRRLQKILSEVSQCMLSFGSWAHFSVECIQFLLAIETLSFGAAIWAWAYEREAEWLVGVQPHPS